MFHFSQFHAHPFASASEAIQFALAGNATLTIRSKKTGMRFTYKIRASEDGNVHFVSLLRGSDNESDFTYFGYIKKAVFFPGGRKARVCSDAPAVQAFEWVWHKLVNGKIPDQLEVWHEGRCGRCGRKLTVPSSIASGFGPECVQYIACAEAA